MADDHHHHHHHKHQILHELLKQEQEPFNLSTYIDAKRSNLQRRKINSLRPQFVHDSRPTNDAVLIQIPSKTAALLVEAATRIQKHSKKSKDGSMGSFMKRALVKDHRNTRRESSRNFDDDSEASGRVCERDDHGDVGLVGKRFRWCRLGFSFKRKSTSTFCSIVASSKQDKNINAQKRCNNVERDQSNEHSSPVSVLEHFFEDDDERESDDDAKEDDSDLESSYANVQRVKEQLLNRLRRFEELAELEPIELLDHIHFVEGNTDEEITSNIDENLQNNNSWKILSNETSNSTGNNKKVFFGGIFKIKHDAAIIDMLIELELKNNNNGSWRIFNEQVEDVAQVIELDIFELLVDELFDRFHCTADVAFLE